MAMIRNQDHSRIATKWPMSANTLSSCEGVGEPPWV
jgi:hypothetical protein